MTRYPTFTPEEAAQLTRAEIVDAVIESLPLAFYNVGYGSPRSQAIVHHTFYALFYVPSGDDSNYGPNTMIPMPRYLYWSALKRLGWI